jgi:fused signal recognition particle receptor
MEELARIRRSQAKALAGAPHEVILVVDGTNGQNALAQVRAFDAFAELTGLIVTKLDGTAKGGVLVAITADRKDKPLPIYFVGVGEQIDDLQPFSARAFASALVGLDEDEEKLAARAAREQANKRLADFNLEDAINESA